MAHADGSHDRYTLPSRAGPRSTLVEPPADDPYWPTLAELATSAQEVSGRHGTLVAESGALSVAAGSPTRALTDDQSNTSAVLDERLVVKCYRRLVPGEHPEPELLAALDRVGSQRAPRFGGSLVRHSSDGKETLACLYAFVPGEPVGWESIIDRLRDALVRDDEPARRGLLDDAAELGAAAAELHVDLASAFGTRPATEEEAGVAAVEARVRLDEALRVATGDLATELASGSSTLESALRHIARLAGSPVTRVHGDLHVAQFVASPQGLVVVDFEGEPGLALGVRRRWTSPLRDVACLLLSLDHVAVAAARRVPDASALERSLEWSDAARTRAIDVYATGIAGSRLELDLLLLRALEIEKECHEVIYAATVLPEWSYAPATVLPRLLDRAGEELT